MGYFESPRTSATGQSTFTFATAWIAVGAAVGFVLIVGAVTLMINHHPKIGEVSGDLLRPIITLILVLVVTALVLAVTLIIFVGMGYALGRNSGRVQHFLGASLIHFTVAGGVASALGFLMLASGLLLIRYRRRRGLILVIVVTVLVFAGVGYELGGSSGRVQHFLGASLTHFTVAGGVASALGFLMIASGLLLVRYRRRREYLR